MQWFVNEQVEEEASVSAIIAKLRMVGGDGYGMLMVDNELGLRADSAPQSRTQADMPPSMTNSLPVQ
jgi:ferritin